MSYESEIRVYHVIENPETKTCLGVELARCFVGRVNESYCNVFETPVDFAIWADDYDDNGRIPYLTDDSYGDSLCFASPEDVLRYLNSLNKDNYCHYVPIAIGVLEGCLKSKFTPIRVVHFGR